MRLVALSILALVLAGCSSVDTARTFIDERGSDLSDRLLEDAEFYLCRAAPIGSINRKYAADPERAQAYRTLCRDSGTETIVEEQ